MQSKAKQVGMRLLYTPWHALRLRLIGLRVVCFDLVSSDGIIPTILAESNQGTDKAVPFEDDSRQFLPPHRIDCDVDAHSTSPVTLHSSDKEHYAT